MKEKKLRKNMHLIILIIESQNLLNAVICAIAEAVLPPAQVP
jgi:hypothetical protein